MTAPADPGRACAWRRGPVPEAARSDAGGRYSLSSRPVSTQTSSMNRTNGDRRSLPPSSTVPTTTAAHATTTVVTASPAATAARSRRR